MRHETHSRLRGRAARFALVLSAALVLLLPAAPVRAASFAFSGPHATSQFDTGIDFSAQLTASETPARVDLQLLMPGSAGPFVVTIPNTPPSGTSTVHYSLDTSGDGHLMPNTPITATWVVYPQSGPPVSSSPFSYRYVDETQHWKTLTDGIVTVHWTQGSESFAQHAGAIATKAISTDASLLGIDESKPVDFFIYADDTSFRNALGPGTRENVGGTAITEIRTLFMEVTPDIVNDPWVGITITHELTHQVVDDAMGNPYRNLPRWLNEGFAVYESEGNASSFRSSLSQAIASGDLLPLTALGWQFPTDPNKTVLGYAESVSAVDFIARKYGVNALVKLILAYKQGPTDDAALQSAVGLDMNGFQTAWYQDIGATPPSQFGPKPAPSGPLPSGWTGAVASNAPGASASGPAAVAAAPTPPAAAPAATPAAAAPSDATGSSGDDLTLVLGAIVLVSAVVLIGIVVAGRRAATP
jgi:hypothetical protein